MQPGWPAFGPPDQGRKVALAEFGRHDRVDQLGGLLDIEPQFAGADLRHLAERAHPGQRQRRFGAGGDDDLHARRETAEQERHLLMAGGLLDQVIVVQDQDDLLRERGHLVDEDREHRPAEVRILAAQRGQDLLAVERRAHQMQGRDHVPPQPDRVIVGAVQ